MGTLNQLMSYLRSCGRADIKLLQSCYTAKSKAKCFPVNETFRKCVCVNVMGNLNQEMVGEEWELDKVKKH